MFNSLFIMQCQQRQLNICFLVLCNSEVKKDLAEADGWQKLQTDLLHSINTDSFDRLQNVCGQCFTVQKGYCFIFKIVMLVKSSCSPHRGADYQTYWCKEGRLSHGRRQGCKLTEKLPQVLIIATLPKLFLFSCQTTGIYLISHHPVFHILLS